MNPTAASDVFVREGLDSDVSLIERHLEMAKVESHNYRGSVPDRADGARRHSFIAGFASTDFASMEVSETGPGRWRIEHVFVEPEAREVGIGDALVRHGLEWMRTKGGTWVEASALPGDRSMKNLFERHGLVAQTITVGKSLSDPSTGEDASR